MLLHYEDVSFFKISREVLNQIFREVCNQGNPE
ncbi:hypothetical protein T4B_6643 [Trichinella pseudospiralis]|uniref:Uncharacterized protein n=1 Tax=Trichinella pseudospiralis TaxID=6337 RepID=A0A0V1GLL2_TRIPS|nr:hypothetical protein T4B_6643 [Trichinella pseudospiralis]